MAAVKAETGPPAARVLDHARSAILTAMSGADGTAGYAEARAVLAAVPAGDLVDVAAVLALMLGRPGTVVLTVPEWHLLATSLRVDP